MKLDVPEELKRKRQCRKRVKEKGSSSCPSEEVESRVVRQDDRSRFCRRIAEADYSARGDSIDEEVKTKVGESKKRKKGIDYSILERGEVKVGRQSIDDLDEREESREPSGKHRKRTNWSKSKRVLKVSD